MAYTVRTVKADEWEELRALRLRALGDPVARIAFCDDPRLALLQADDYWKARAVPLSDGGTATNLIAVDEDDGTWVGMLAVLDETGSRGPVQEPDGAALPDRVHIVSVYVLPEHRGTGVAEALLRGAVAWSWENTPAQRVRLWVHERNSRALAFYLRLGFVRTGERMPFPSQPEETEHELEIRRGTA
ncbi:GNAT family N-acetyltransferase [Streptomyces meridianus]|uniref:GNAT family N-acetyltransferase n=1 Tax=Streptomyces meridianus TaxID=2938945 RepID=A0ABT0X6L5_9ACTN|nr:GNAT family N-acetyltransferase [Streptomyces meridianus]MCM2577352.1 GNAT family N-acetyltransferase [Streptomyces meridianus]